MTRRTLIPLSVFLVILFLLTDICSATIRLKGNTAGAPPSAPKEPCPRHGVPSRCCSTLNPSAVQFISSPSQWFRDTLEDEYKPANWDFRYVGGIDSVDANFNVLHYGAYNDCPGLLGAEFNVRFDPNAGSLISDILWVQTVRITKKDGSTFTVVDDKTPPPEVQPPTVPNPMPGPFYPYQDEDGLDSGWQSSDQREDLWDKPGFFCPCVDDWVAAYFETYASWLYGQYDASGNIIPMPGETKPRLWIYEGMGWGFQNTCIPEPATLLLLGLGGLLLRRRKSV